MDASTFKLKTPHISGGRSHTPLAKTEHMTIGLNYYIPGRKNKLHTHPGEDHTFLVIDGQATFYNKDDQSTVLTRAKASCCLRTITIISRAPVIGLWLSSE